MVIFPVPIIILIIRPSGYQEGNKKECHVITKSAVPQQLKEKDVPRKKLVLRIFVPYIR